VGYKGDGVERPFLDKQGHTAECRVWENFDQRFNCTCGAVTAPEPKAIPGFSDYQISIHGEVFQLSTGKFLRVENASGVLRLRDDEGGRHSFRIRTLINQTFGTFG